MKFKSSTWNVDVRVLEQGSWYGLLLHLGTVRALHVVFAYHVVQLTVDLLVVECKAIEC